MARKSAPAPAKAPEPPDVKPLDIDSLDAFNRWVLAAVARGELEEKRARLCTQISSEQRLLIAEAHHQRELRDLEELDRKTEERERRYAALRTPSGTQ